MDTYFNPYEIYEGDKPFIFISYAHDDSHIVMPIVESLQKEGFRVWYDEAIELGSEWPEYIAEHLKICSCCLAFITQNSLKSINCRQEINFAITHDRNPVAIYLEEVQLTPGMELRLGSIKAMYYTKFKDHEKFLYKLRTAKLLQPCLGPKPRLPVSPDTKISREAVQTITFLNQLSNSPKASWDVSKHWGSKTICWAYESDGLYDVFLAADGGVIAPENGTDLFKDCSALKQIDFSGFNTSRLQNLSRMFCGCSSLTDIDLSDWDVSHVKTMNSMFRDCTALRSINVSGWDTSNVTTMYSMFYNACKLQTLKVDHWNTAKVTDMTWMFGNCHELTELDISQWNTSSVKSMYAMFHKCEKLTSLDVSRWNTAKVTDMSWMFGRCRKLTELDVSHFDTCAVTTCAAMFKECTALSKLDVSGFQTSHMTDVSWMFHSCPSLPPQDLGKWDLSAVTKYDYFMDSNRQINGAPWERLFA